MFSPAVLFSQPEYEGPSPGLVDTFVSLIYLGHGANPLFSHQPVSLLPCHSMSLWSALFLDFFCLLMAQARLLPAHALSFFLFLFPFPFLFPCPSLYPHSELLPCLGLLLCFLWHDQLHPLSPEKQGHTALFQVGYVSIRTGYNI